MRGYFGIGIVGCKTHENFGTLFRSANIFGAKFIFLVGKRFEKQRTDTMRTERHIPLTEYASLDAVKGNLPIGCKLVGVELDENAVDISNYKHPERACYVLGAEDRGLNPEELSICDDIIKLPGKHSLNVAVAGSIVLYDRINRRVK